MAELKTKKNTASVSKFLLKIEDPKKRSDAKKFLAIFKSATNLKPVMWGDAIIGFGQYHYKSERSKQEGDWPLTGFSPRKQNFSIYIMPGFKKYQKELEKLGKHKTSVSCLYIKKLEDVDEKILEKIIKDSVKEMKKIHKVK